MNATWELRVITSLRVVSGCGLLFLADPITRNVTGGGGDGTMATAVRLLGARQLGEAAVLSARPSRRVMLAGAAVDGVHALTMLAIAAAGPRYRRPALISAASGSGLAAAGVVLARSARA